MKTGLYFGSFNPVHTGHLCVASYMAEFTDLDRIWFVVSPHNPLKKTASLLDDDDRLAMVEAALANDPRFGVCRIEFGLPRPSYTIDTLAALRKQSVDEFVIVSGTDILADFHKWKNYELLLANETFYVFPRHGTEDHPLLQHSAFTLFDAPKIEISSTFIRRAIHEGRNVRHFVPDSVHVLLMENDFYR